MIGRKLFTVVMTLALAVSLLASPAHAVKGCSPFKNGVKGCKNEIAGCANLCIDAQGCNAMTKAKDKHKCIRTCKHGCKKTEHDLCKTNPTTCTSSPSGAFLRQ